MYGRTDTAEYPRQSTGLFDMAAAEALRNSLAAEGRDEQIHGPRLNECAEKYLASRAHELSAKTRGQHTLLLSRLVEYCAKQNVYFAQELSVDLLESFKTDGLPALADTSRGTATAKLRCFLREALRRGWIDEPLAEKVRPHRAAYEAKSPFSDDEVTRILSGVEQLGPGTHGYAKHPATLRLLLELMLGTGMRVGDAIRYDPAAAIKGERLWVYTFHPQKARRAETPKLAEAYIPTPLKSAIDKCHWLSPSLPFHFGSASDPAYLANEVYARMQTIGARCDVSDCRPHRLRDTFAVRALLRGVQLDDLSRLLGHSSVKVTEMYYAKWVPARRLRLERLVAETLVDPRGH